MLTKHHHHKTPQLQQNTNQRSKTRINIKQESYMSTNETTRIYICENKLEKHDNREKGFCNRENNYAPKSKQYISTASIY